MFANATSNFRARYHRSDIFITRVLDDGAKNLKSLSVFYKMSTEKDYVKFLQDQGKCLLINSKAFSLIVRIILVAVSY